jgi:hypothetical protein
VAGLTSLPRAMDGDRFRRTVVIAVVPDFDCRAIIGLEPVPGVQFGNAIGKDCLPVGAQVQYRAIEARTRHATSDDGNDPALASTALPQFANRI